MSHNKLTTAQARILAFIESQIKSQGYPPSIREICEEMGYRSPNAAKGHLEQLEKKGAISRKSGKSRSIQLTQTGLQAPQGLPIAGRVATGALMESIEQPERIALSHLFPHKQTFLLQVDGDSMIDAQIAPGDYVVVKKKNTAHKGDIVVAQTGDGKATLKYWHPEKNRIRLQPTNKNMKSTYTKDAKIIGVVIGVIRKYG